MSLKVSINVYECSLAALANYDAAIVYTFRDVISTARRSKCQKTAIRDQTECHVGTLTFEKRARDFIA